MLTLKPHKTKIMTNKVFIALSWIALMTFANLIESSYSVGAVEDADIQTDPNFIRVNEDTIAAEKLSTMKKSVKHSKEQLANLQNWLIQEGSTFHEGIYTEIHKSGQILLKSTKKIFKGENIHVSPLSNTFNLKMAAESEKGKDMTSFKISLHSPPKTYLSTILLSEEKKGQDSQWYPYFSTLSTEDLFSRLPLNYNKDELSLLKGCSMELMIKQKLEGLKDDYKEVCKAIPGFEQEHSFEDFKKWRAVISRNKLTVIQDEANSMLVSPFTNLIQHRINNNISWEYNDTIKELTFYANQDIPADREISMSFGRLCNSRLLLNYGLVQYENEAHTQVTMDVDKYYFQDRKFFKEKLEFFETRPILNARNFTFRFNSRLQDVNMIFAMGYLRFMSVDNKADMHT